MDWTAELAASNVNLDTYRAADPATAKMFTGLHHAAMRGDALDLKTRELIALGIGIARQCVDCIGFHVKAAAAAGATRDEIAACVSVSIMMGGGPAFMYGAKALEAYDQLAG